MVIGRYTLYYQYEFFDFYTIKRISIMNADFLYFVGVGIASFNKRYGCLNDSSQDEMLNLLNTILKTLQTAYLMPFDINRYYKTKTYREFEQTYLQLQE